MEKEIQKNKNSEAPLDFCRVKKIFDKGFGFLSSLYYEENIFFHFSKIKDSEVRVKLSKMKRGSVSLFYTSEIYQGKRRVNNVWTNITDVPSELLPNFIKRLTEELNSGVQNPFEIIEALAQLRNANFLSEKDYLGIIKSKKSERNPTILLKLLSNEEEVKLAQLSLLIDESKNDTELNYKKVLNILMK